MRWFDDSDDSAAKARFRQVSRPKVLDLSWAEGSVSSQSGGDVVTLRPPRLPSLDGGSPSVVPPLRGSSDGDDEEVSGLHPAPDGVSRVEVSESPAQRLSRPPEVEPRRMDTMIDDIVPRAEEEAVARVREVAAEIVADRDRIGAEAEERLVELALLVARRVIAREVSMDPAVVLGLVREGIAALGEKDRIVVRVGRFYSAMREAIADDLASAKVRCEVVVDPALGETGCVVETALGRVDESVDVRLANLMAGLSSRDRGRR